MRMTRAQIEEWYTEQKRPNLGGIVFRAIQNEGRLILGAWKSKARVGIYVLSENGRHAVKRVGGEWSAGGIYTLFDWHPWYGLPREAYDEKHVRFANQTSCDTAIPFLQSCKNDWSGDSNIIRWILHIEETFGESCRRTREINKQKRIDAVIDALPPLPEDLYAWAHETAFDGAHYMFGTKNCDIYYCTACGKKHVKKHLRDRERTVCARTGKPVKVEKRTDAIVRECHVQVIQNMPDGKNAVARHLTLWQTWKRSNITQKHGEQMVILLPKDGKSSASKWYYHVRGGYLGNEFWTDSNLANYRVRREYCYPHTVVEGLRDTVYSRLGLEIAAARGWELQYNNLMMAWTQGQIEYLIKGGFYQLLRDISDTARPGYLGGLCSVGKNVQEALMLSGQGVARLRAADGGLGYLRWLRKSEESGEHFSEEVLVWLGKHFPYGSEIDFATQHMSYTRIVNYLSSQMKKSRLPLINLLHKWRDYLNMAKKFKLDLSRESVYRPKDLAAAHTELTEILNAKRDELERERIESEYPAVAPTCERIKALYEWSDGTHAVVVPSGAGEIMREGRLLSHCVGTTDRYFDRIAEGESYILFLRKCKDVTAPWYTMEVEPGGAVRQLRTYGDDEGKDRAEAKKALIGWRSEITKRLRCEKGGKLELRAAETSREKRLAEFEELRRGGNVIRNGRLAGQLLVEVLEADFREFNEEDAACAV